MSAGPMGLEQAFLGGFRGSGAQEGPGRAPLAGSLLRVAHEVVPQQRECLERLPGASFGAGC